MRCFLLLDEKPTITQAAHRAAEARRQAVSHPFENERPDKVARSDTDNIWMRGLVMLIIMACVGLAQSVLFAVAVVQFLWMLIARERNGFLIDFGRALGLWQAEAAWFLSGDTDEKPFPWKAWPRS